MIVQTETAADSVAEYIGKFRSAQRLRREEEIAEVATYAGARVDYGFPVLQQTGPLVMLDLWTPLYPTKLGAMVTKDGPNGILSYLKIADAPVLDTLASEFVVRCDDDLSVPCLDAETLALVILRGLVTWRIRKLDDLDRDGLVLRFLRIVRSMQPDGEPCRMRLVRDRIASLRAVQTTMTVDAGAAT